MKCRFIAILSCLLAALTVLGDGNDWVNVDYILEEAQKASSPNYANSLSVNAILRGADRLSNKGPWSVTNEKGILPPSQDAHDYLSWAPYHWPDCRWCSKSGRTQLAHTRDGSNNSSMDTAERPGPSDSPDDDQPYEESIDFVKRSAFAFHLAHHGRMIKVHKPRGLVESLATILPGSLIPTAILDPIHTVPVPQTSPSSTETKVSRSATRPPAQAAAKTTRTTCTPSPTTSMAPSATYTVCPYIGRDGHVNPDVRSLNGPGSINSLSQYVLYGCISSSVNKDSKHSRGVVNAIDTFFLSSATRMSPDLKYGQVVRGPGPQGSSGTFTGILDIRGLVKVVNGILVLKGINHPDWTAKRDTAMLSWVSQYSQWLMQSDIGKLTASKPNNHGTFYVSQLVAAKIYAGSKDEAISILIQFFKKQFLDQIAASGEQPFEAIRTRPYHYRCFNLEALITNAKLGDQLGLDLWSSRSKYGATIQTAMDFVIASKPNGENAQEALPHVAAVAAAYGDPKGKYSAFLKKSLKNYQEKPFWFYDQPKAIRGDPSSSKKAIKRGSELPTKIPFTCPDVFKDATSVEIDNGLFVTCEELRPLYEASVPDIE